MISAFGCLEDMPHVNYMDDKAHAWCRKKFYVMVYTLQAINKLKYFT